MKMAVDAPDDSVIKSKDKYSDMGVVSTTDKEDAAQDMLDAIKASDATALALAFERMMDCCSDEAAESEE